MKNWKSRSDPLAGGLVTVDRGDNEEVGGGNEKSWSLVLLAEGNEKDDEADEDEEDEDEEEPKENDPKEL